MANEQHVALVKQGTESWNQWRQANPGIVPDLSGADLNEANLSGTNLSEANLNGTNLSWADLSRANLNGANLIGVNLSRTNLSRAILSGAILSEINPIVWYPLGEKFSGANFSGITLKWAKLKKPNLSGAILSEADLKGLNLSGVNLSGAILTGVYLSGQNLNGANLSGATLSGADLNDANLNGANLSGAKLKEANLSGAKLSGAKLSGADLTGTNLSKADLSGADLTETIFDNPSLHEYTLGHHDNPLLSATLSSEYTRLDAVNFTAYYPLDVQQNRRYSLYVYAHLYDAIADIATDLRKFAGELGDQPPTRKTAKLTGQIFPKTPITVVPECDQVKFGPSSLTKVWDSDWVRFGFDFKLTPPLLQDVLLIRVSVRVAAIEIANISCTIDIDTGPHNARTRRQEARSENPLAAAKFNSVTSKLYRQVFVSYSRKDKDVVELYKLVQLAVGDIVFMDTYSIRAGEDWRAAVASAIDSADIFQLFWSRNSARSDNVSIEWDYALRYECPENGCRGFIRPVYWTDPIKPKPPERLDHLHFKFVPLEDFLTPEKKQS